MATIAEFHLDADDAALGDAFDRLPSLTCELERVVESERPSVWISGAEEADTEDALEADPSIESFDRITSEGDRTLYEIEFAEETCALLELLVENRGTLLTGKAAKGQWSLRIRFPDRSHLRRTYERLTEEDVAVDIGRLYELSEESSHELGLTSSQYESLVAAVERGYFEIPRRVSMQELAVELDISHQALSERLRRAYGTLATAELGPSFEPEAIEVD